MQPAWTSNTSLKHIKMITDPKHLNDLDLDLDLSV